MRRSRSLIFSIAALLALASAHVRAADETASALERDPGGWTDLIADAGSKLEGWTRVPIPPDGKLSAISQWSLDPKSGIIVCAGDGGHDWLRYDKEVGDAIFHVEWRFVPIPNGKRYNSGVFIRNSADGAIWHQAQTGDASGGHIFGQTPVNGKPQRVNLSKTVTDKRVKPAGEWNTFEITARGKDMALWVNGATTCQWHDCEVPRGYVGLEAEGFRIEFRNVKLKPL